VEARVGLFSWLFGKPDTVEVREIVWQTSASRSRAVAKELAEHVAAGRSVLLLAHFPATLAALAPDLLGENLPREAIPDGFTPQVALRSGPPRVLFGLVRNLRPDEFPAEDAPESPLPVLLMERHFLRRHDDRVSDFARGLGGRSTVAVHSSFDDPLIRMFVGNWVRDMLKQLGMEDDEAIDSGMVNRRIRQAQDKITPRVREEEVPADSPEEWYRLNQKW
jgi:hypothetical protein